MPRLLHSRAAHYLLLLAASAVLFLPNLGGPSLWDIDEGNNLECAREMFDSGNWVVPTFNYNLRVDKPALLYWLQIAAYHVLGVGELAGRLPSALASALAVLLTYELGRRLFRPSTGLLAGLVLASSTLFSAAAHFANPDALLKACTILYFLAAWLAFSRGPRWLVLGGAAAGLAVLAKGPVGLALPGAAFGLFLVWSRRLNLLWSRYFLLAGLVGFFIAAPWYVWVGLETRGEFPRGFFLQHNVGRYLSPMEGHGGGLWYYPLVLIAGLAPWSAFLGLALWSAVGRRARADQAAADRPGLPDAYRFLWSWLLLYLVFFSLSSTKLPNYVLPAYAPVALMLGRFLDRWRQGELALPEWLAGTGMVLFGLVGVVVAVGLVLAARRLPGMQQAAPLGLALVGGAVAALAYAARGRRSAALGALAVGAVAFLGGAAVWGVAPVDAHKAPRPLARLLDSDGSPPEIRVACYGWFQPSTVFYCRRRVYQLGGENEVREHLQYPMDAYLFVTAEDWEAGLKGRIAPPARVLARHRDLYRNQDVLVVVNR